MEVYRVRLRAPGWPGAAAVGRIRAGIGRRAWRVRIGTRGVGSGRHVPRIAGHPTSSVGRRTRRRIVGMD
ncbi:hypothetical protein ABD05_00820 [Burkholderia pyrrocinia]|nr:hypothetical protein ABD05_00820 [Burkholderia pyrrocinia]